VPRGAGELALLVEPLEAPLRPLRLEEPGEVRSVEGIAVSSRLTAARVSDRMADACAEALAEARLACAIERVYDDASPQAGAGIAVWAETDSGCLLGADGSGAPGRRSEWIGRKAATELLADLGSGATADRHAADMLVLWSALANGESRWIAPRATEHLTTNLWLMEKLGARTRLEGTRAVVDGVSLPPPRRVS
jgi:RNA 3'-terminal phosphate cyclase (ATP)